MISIICAIAAYELLSATKIRKVSVIVYTIFAAVLIPFAIFLNSLIGGTTMMLIALLLSIFFLLLCLLVIEAVLAFSRTDNAKQTPPLPKGAKKKKSKSDDSYNKFKFRQIPIALAAGILIPYLLSSLISLREMPHGYLFVLLPVVIAIMTDSGAFFSGVALGKTKPFPKISPNKTTEGFIGGIVIGTAGMLIYGLILSAVTSHTIFFPALALYGVLGSIMTILGDLAFSLIKRKCGIKDYGRLFPGHGGALDRFDSMTFAAPTMYFLTLLIPAIII